MTYEYHDINAQDAIYNLARRYPGGVEALAARMGVSAKVLYNKLSPRVSTHVLTSEEFSLTIEYCREAKVDGYLQPLLALNYRHDVVGFQLPDTVLLDSDLNGATLRVMSEYGDVTRAIAEAKAGDTPEQRRIDKRELAKIREEFRQAHQELVLMEQAVIVQAEADQEEAKRPLRVA